MTTTQRRRHTALERAFAEGTISPAELPELEALRDLAGQGWLLDPGQSEAPEETAPDPREEIARRQARRLVAHDAGETQDLFGQGLLL